MSFQEGQFVESSGFRERRERIVARLRAAGYVTERGGQFRIESKEIRGVQAWVCNTRSDYEVPLEYPRTELYLIALLGEPDAFRPFMELVEPQKARDEAAAAYSAYLRTRVVPSGVPLVDHDMGRGLPDGMRPALIGKKILFVGGGSKGAPLLGRYFSDGAVAVNVDYHATGFRPQGWNGPDVDIRDEYNESTAARLADTFGPFDAIVIQNVLDAGALDDAGEVASMLRGLGTNLAKEGVLMLQTDHVDSACHREVASFLSSERLAEAAQIEVLDGYRGECKVYVRL